MKNTRLNQEIIQNVAKALGDLNDNVIYVGGATVSLYIDDTAANDVRATNDVDISVEIGSLTQLEALREELISKGFKQSADLKVICRFKLDDILIDVMGTNPIGWAPANPWFELGFKNRKQIQVREYAINIMPLPYFLASKFVAHTNRGGNDPRMSHDFEDIIYILDNRSDWYEMIFNADDEVKTYLLEQFKNILESNRMQEAILGNLSYQSQDERYKMIMEKITKLY